jgi:cytochrome c oxidase subunit IV
VGGLFLSVMGFALCLRPLSAVVSFVPLLGSLTSGLLFVVAMLLGGIVSLTTIGMAWIAVRPLLGISALALAAAGVFAIAKLRRSAQAQAELPMAELTGSN